MSEKLAIFAIRVDGLLLKLTEDEWNYLRAHGGFMETRYEVGNSIIFVASAVPKENEKEEG